MSRMAVARLRWGIPDAAIAWLVGLVLSLVVLTPFLDAHGTLPRRLQVEGTLAALVAQSVGIVAALFAIARRKGLGSLRDDFGLTLRAQDVAPWLVVGIVLSSIAQALLVPITELGDIHGTRQEVARVLQHSAGLREKALFLVATVVVAPVAEELLFRGVLLRALARRVSPGLAVFVAASAFALVHPLGDVDIAYAVPAFLLLGLVSGQRALATGSLSQSICLHAGFNLLSAVVILA